MISYLAISAILTTPVFFKNQIENYYWFCGMLLLFSISIIVIRKSFYGDSLKKWHAMFVAIFIGIIFSTYLDSILNTSVLIIATNSIIAVLLGILLANTDSKQKREDLLIFMWCYVPIKIITIIVLLNGTMQVKINAPFISIFIMGIVVIVLQKTWHLTIQYLKNNQYE
jgi:hypothetical protein